MKAGIVVAFVVSLALPAIAQPANKIPAEAPPAPSIWSIDILGLKGESLGNFTIQLLGESCNWAVCESRVRKARLLQSSVQSPALTREFEAKGYFPTYRVENKRLTILLNHYFDFGLLLSGPFTAREGKGDYIEWKRGSRSRLGTFTARRLQR